MRELPPHHQAELIVSGQITVYMINVVLRDGYVVLHDRLALT